jgi:hypothetical protein
MDDFKALRLNAGAKIDPNTPHVSFHWGYVVDPYGDRDDLTPEEKCVGRLYFARSPEPDSVALSFDDLPRQTVEALEKRIKRGDFDDDCPWHGRESGGEHLGPE